MKVKIRGIETREEDFEILEMICIEEGCQGKE